jgi:hypothetical protein
MITLLSQLVAAVESGGNPYAIRFEPAHTPSSLHIATMATIAKCSVTTAKILCACSFGLYQIMGDELVSMGLLVSPLAFCADVNAQLRYFNLYLSLDHIDDYTLSDILTDQTKREHFAALYNGPGNVAGYSQRLLDVYKANQR